MNVLIKFKTFKRCIMPRVSSAWKLWLNIMSNVHDYKIIIIKVKHRLDREMFYINREILYQLLLFLWEWGDINVIKRLSTSILFLYTYKTLQKCSSTEIFYWQTAELRFHHCKKLYLLHTKNLCWPCKGFGFYLIWDIFRLLHGSFYIASYITRGCCIA